MLIDLFIKAGWYTVPLEGTLERLPSGKKTVPKFDTEWKSKYAANFNEKRVPLAGVLTGKLSNIIAIDCDNDVTYSMFKAFDPDYNFHFISKGKPSGGGTIIYKYTDEVGGFKLSNDIMALDFYSDEGFVYLPTEGNQTKESWQGTTDLPGLREAPPAVIALLRTLKAKVPEHTVAKSNVVKHTISNRLAPMITQLLKKKEYDPIVFKVLTPYSFRDLPSYVTKGHLHPRDVPTGRGSEYLSKVSAILGADISINIELYVNTMQFINSLWQDPMEKSQLNATIINPMIEGRATVDGDVIWRYDEHWEEMGFIATSLNGDYIESFFDDVKGLYYLINYTVPYIKTFNEKTGVIKAIRSLTGRTVTDGQYDSTKQLIRTSLNPALEFGHIEGSDRYNLFRQTEELAVLNNPGPYKASYSRPNTIIKYFETLIPDDNMRAYVLSFLRTKLTTFEYSPVVLYMIGKPGSGKDTLVTILAKILGRDYIAKPDTKVFLEQYNGWMIDKYIVQLDEYGNKLTRSSDKQEALGKIKAYTGSSDIQIRAMRNDGFNYRHSTTFIMTANSNPLPVEYEDRRFAFIKTPNKLVAQEWVTQLGGIRHVVEQLIPSEIMDFCYYLATEVKNLGADSYVIAPMTEDKEALILENLPAAERILYYIQNERWEELKELAIEYNVVNFTVNWDKNRLMDDKLAELYEAMTDGAGVHRTLIKFLKGINIHRTHTTNKGQNVFYYMINGLYRHKVEDVAETETQFNQVTPKGIS